MQVRLEDHNGTLVHEGVLPPYSAPPSVIVWNMGCYSLHVQADGPEGPHSYREVFGYIMPMIEDNGMRPMRGMR